MASHSPQSSPMPPPQAPSPRASLQQDNSELISQAVTQPMVPLHQQNVYAQGPPAAVMSNHTNVSGLPSPNTANGMQQVAQTFPSNVNNQGGAPHIQSSLQVLFVTLYYLDTLLNQLLFHKLRGLLLCFVLKNVIVKPYLEQ